MRKPIELTAIVWPVFRLGEHEPQQLGGLIFYSKEYLDIDTVNYSNRYRVVDDKNIDKPTLGLRRLQINDELFPIGTAIYFLHDLIKLAKPSTWFIDSHGKIFQHKKSMRAKLKTYKIKQVLPIQSIGCILEIEGLAERFKSLQVPQSNDIYAGILTYAGSNILYGYYAQPIKPTWRLV